MNKRGIELGINLIVTLIIAVIILSFGIYFTKLMFEKSTELKETLDKQTESELERLMDSGEKVSIYPGKREVNNNEIAVFGLGILNIDSSGRFIVTIKPDIATRSDNTEICRNTACNKLEIKTVYNSNEFALPIESNKKEKVLIGILPQNAESGTYVFNIKVTKDSEDYGDFKKIYVKVR